MATIASRLIGRLTSERLPRVRVTPVLDTPAPVHQVLIGLLIGIVTLVALLGFAGYLAGLFPGLALAG